MRGARTAPARRALGRVLGRVLAGAALAAALVGVGLAALTPAADANAASSASGVFVAIVSRDAATFARLAGACYVITGGSLEGCDENGDGRVDFRGVNPGTYTVTQTWAPAGYRWVADFEIVVAAGQAQTVRVALLPAVAVPGPGPGR